MVSLQTRMDTMQKHMRLLCMKHAAYSVLTLVCWGALAFRQGGRAWGCADQRDPCYSCSGKGGASWYTRDSAGACTKHSFQICFLGFPCILNVFLIQVVDVESDDDDEPPVVGAAVEGLPEADAEMSDGAAPAVVEVKNDQQMPGPVAPPVLDARQQELEELKRKYDALLQSMQQLQLQKLGPNSPEQVKMCFFTCHSAHNSWRIKFGRRYPCRKHFVHGSSTADRYSDLIFCNISNHFCGSNWVGFIYGHGFNFWFWKCSGCCNVSGGWSGGPRILDCTFKVLTPAAPN